MQLASQALDALISCCFLKKNTAVPCVFYQLGLAIYAVGVGHHKIKKP
jgi:hypothetical protein